MKHPVNRRHFEELTLGERSAEALAARIGSWPFLIVQSVVLAGWIALNVIAVVRHWDPYPFILLNLALSFQAAYTGPVLLIASNRQSAKDRDLAEHSYEVELELQALLKSNTELTQAVHVLTEQIHRHVCRDEAAAS